MSVGPASRPARGQAESRKAATGKAATQERILAAATELFIQRGYDATRMLDIATHAGVSRATVFWHFQEKAGLFREAFSRLLAPFRESLARDFHDVPPERRLEEHLRLSEQFASDHRHEIAAFVRWAVESPELRDGVVKPLLDLNQRFAAALQKTVAEIAPPDAQPELLATGLMLAFDANLLLSIFDPRPAATEHRGSAVRALAALVSGKATPDRGPS